MMDMDQTSSPHAIYPRISQLGSSDEFELGRNETTLRLFYYHGVTDDAGPEIPFSTSTNWNKGGDQLTFDSLVWHSWLITLWQKRIEMYDRDAWFEKRVKLKFHELMDFKITDRHRMEYCDFLIKQMRIELGNDIGEAILTCLQI